MADQIIFGGTQTEKFALMNAINRHCECAYGVMGSRIRTCQAHNMLINDQRAINGLVANRRRAAELLLQEFLLPGNNSCSSPSA